MEERGGKKEKKREEDRRWQRLPWPGPHSFTSEPNFQAFQKPLGYRQPTTWKAPGYHLVATILIALLSMLVRPTVGGKDKYLSHVHISRAGIHVSVK